MAARREFDSIDTRALRFRHWWPYGRRTPSQLHEREFSRSTQAIHQYWLYELCDVYIENSKSIIRDGTPEERASALETLYTALENALTMIHPFMPFLTEELWQRLPRRPEDETRSIVIASYPQYDAKLDDPTSEKAYDIILGSSKGVRSLIQEYGIKENGKAFVQPLTEDAYATASKEAASIKVLSGKYLSELTVLKANEAPPVPAAVYPVSSSVAVFLELQGSVDAGREIEKTKPKMQKTAAAVKEQQKLIGTLGDKVGAEVKALEDQKLHDLLTEQKVFEQSIERFEQMKL